MPLTQVRFPVQPEGRESNPNFPWGKSHWDNTAVKKKVKSVRQFLKVLMLENTLDARKCVNICACLPFYCFCSHIVVCKDSFDLQLFTLER